MKKIFNKLTIILLALIFCLSLTACGKTSETHKGDERTVKTAFSFEDEFEFSKLSFQGNVGSATLSQNFVTKGEYSMQYIVSASFDKQFKGFSYFDVKAEDLGLTEGCDVDYIGLDIFNDGKDNISVYLKALDENDQTLYSNSQIVGLGVKTQVRFYNNGLFNSDVKPVKYRFFLHSNKIVENGLKVYIDNIMVVERTYSPKVEKMLSYGEIISFNDYSDLQFVNIQSPSVLPPVSLSYERDSLCVNWLGELGYEVPISYINVTKQKTSLKFYNGMLDMIEFSGVNYLFLDIYNDGFETKTMEFWFKSGQVEYSTSVEVIPTSWQTVRVKTDGRQVDEIGLTFNTADVLSQSKTLIRNLRYVA